MARTATETETPRTRKVRKTTARKRVGNGRTRTASAKPKPNGDLDQFGFRSGSLKAKAAAMYASKDGATLAEVKTALKSSQFNLLTELEARKIKILRTQVPGAGPRKVTRYKIISK
jgi:hypothetical protein